MIDEEDYDLYEQMTDDVRKLLTRCRENRITLNPKKFRFIERQVKFAGYLVSEEEIEAEAVLMAFATFSVEFKFYVRKTVKCRQKPFSPEVHALTG